MDRKYLADTACSDHIINSSKGLIDIQVLPRDHIIEGISGNVLVQLKGTHPDFGQAYIIKDGPNLISVARLTETHEISSPDGKSILFTPKETGAKTFIARPNPSHVYEISEHNVSDGTIKSSLSEPIAFSAQTSKHDTVWILHELLSHISEQRLCEAVKSGEYSIFNLTTKDIRDADLHQCLGCAKGKMQAGHPPSHYSFRRREVESEPDEIEDTKPQIGQHQHADVIFVKYIRKKVAYFISVDQTTGFIYYQRLNSLDSDTMFEAIKGLVTFHRAYQRDRKESEGMVHLHTDKASSIIRLSTDGRLSSLGVTLVHVSPEVHEKRAERNSRAIKDKCRATIHGLSYPLPSVLLPDLFEYVVLSMNQSPNNKTRGVTPWRLVTTEAVTGEWFQVPFGCVGLFQDPYTGGTMEAKSRIGIVSLRGGRSRSLKTLMLESRTGADATSWTHRDKVVPLPLPLPNEVLTAIQRIVEKEVDFFHEATLLELETPPRVSVPILDRGQLLLDQRGELGAPLPAHNEGVDTEVQEEREGIPQIEGVERSDAAVAELETSESVTRRVLLHNNRLAGIGLTPLDAGTPAIEPTNKSTRVVGGESESGEESDSANGSLERSGEQAEEAEREPSLLPANRTHPEPDTVVSNNVSNSNYPVTSAEGVTNDTGRATRVKERRDYTRLNDYGFLANHEPREVIAYLAQKEAAEEQSRKREDLNAMELELNQIIDQKVFSPVSAQRLTNREIQNAINTVMLLTDKYGPDGTYIKVKARLVVKGYEDKSEGVRTHSPTVNEAVVMLALNTAACQKYQIDIFDVGGAFLEADINRPDLLIRVSDDVAKVLTARQPDLKAGKLPDGTLLVKLKKALYGLRESPRLWYETISTELKKLGFNQSKHDPCLYTKKIGDQFHYVLIHVDDILSTGPRTSMDKLRSMLSSRFRKVSENINPSKFNYLGMSATRHFEEKTIEIRQHKYIEGVIAKLELQADQTSQSPCTEKLFEETTALTKPLSTKMAEMFTSITMSMLYITKSRPDIKCAVAYLSTRLQNPNIECWYKMLRVARYLNGTKDLPFVIRGTNMTLSGSADASFAVHKDRKSHTGTALWVGDRNAPILTSSKKQRLVTSSSTEAELVAANSAVQDIVWLRNILQEMGYVQREPTKLHQDNKSCIIMANQGHGGRFSRAIDIKYFWISEKISERKVNLLYTPSEDMIADGLTKALPLDKFLKWRKIILNH